MADADSNAAPARGKRWNNSTPAHKAACVKYERTTKKGFLMRAYRNMRSRVLGIQWRKHHLYAGKDILPRDEFYAWSLACPSFNALWEAWQAGGRQRKEAPSIDRRDSDYGYELWNMRWVPFVENCRNIKQSKRRKPAMPAALPVAAPATPPRQPIPQAAQQSFEFA